MVEYDFIHTSTNNYNQADLKIFFPCDAFCFPRSLYRYSFQVMTTYNDQNFVS